MKNITYCLFGLLVGLSLLLLPKTSDAQTYVQVGTSSGERCLDPVPADIGYRPSLFECNGNAAILFRGEFRRAYSVVLRRNGEKNDRDRFNPGCSLASCSPFKVQKVIYLPEQDIHCLGDNGFGVELGLANRISIKFRPDVTDSSDLSQFRQYCLFDKQTSLH